jgi:hypothetical protein
MKQFLRYQISGITFLIWLYIFRYGVNEWNILSSIEMIEKNLILTKQSATVNVIIAIPIGVIIHQMSVFIKNKIVARCWKEFDDFPSSDLKRNINNNKDVTEYCLERISNLNSFYYLRVDNGFLAPFLALLIIMFSTSELKGILVLYFLLIAIILLSYIPRIRKEINAYKNN